MYTIHVHYKTDTNKPFAIKNKLDSKLCDATITYVLVNCTTTPYMPASHLTMCD